MSDDYQAAVLEILSTHTPTLHWSGWICAGCRDWPPQDDWGTRAAGIREHQADLIVAAQRRFSDLNAESGVQS